MGYVKTQTFNQKEKPPSKRRRYLPEPCQYDLLEPQVYQVSYAREAPGRQRRQRLVRAEFTHTSILTAIRNYVVSLSRPSRCHSRKSHRRRKRPESLLDMISSLKCDLQKMSKCKEEIRNNPEKVKCTDPFFLLPAMMCKLNKLEDCLIRKMECDKKMALKKDVLITANCIRKSLLDQLRSDEKLLIDKKKKMCCLVKSLEIFEKQIRCSNKGRMDKCCPPPKCPPKELCSASPKAVSKVDLCDCPDKRECAHSCPSKVHESPALLGPPASPPPSPPPPPLAAPPPPCEQYDITGMNLVYTKSDVETDCQGRERSTVRGQVCWDTEDCQITVVRDGNECDLCCEDPVVKAKISKVSRIWLESARQLLDAFCDSPSC